MSEPPTPRRLGDALAVGAVALAARLAVVAWAGARFPPAGDGEFYQRIAERIAAGHGYTWLWPDGVVTYAAHYPVGYPALVGLVYALVGPRLVGALVVNALLGALAAFAVHRAVHLARAPRAAPLAAGLLVALHPALVLYTPALMTEGAAATLVACAAWAASHARAVAVARGRLPLWAVAALGLVLGAATIVRPQCLALAPLLGAVVGLGRAGEPLRRRAMRALGAAALTTTVVLAACSPWTARNCVRMKSCALVSVNGGWNLLIGADPASTGAWSPVQVPVACREVWDEAGKDACFGRAARAWIAENPVAWARLVPKKLAATFDYCGAAGWYLHQGNPGAFDEAAKVSLGVVETLCARVLVLLALLGVARAPSAEGRGGRVLRLALLAGAMIAALGEHGFVAYALLPLFLVVRARDLDDASGFELGALLVLAATVATHAVFFGAGRYSLVVFPLIAGLAGPVLAAPRRALLGLVAARPPEPAPEL
jgi:hypothetical protein